MIGALTSLSMNSNIITGKSNTRSFVMHITSKGQVTIPLELREKYGFNEESEVDFVEENGRVYLRKSENRKLKKNRVQKVRGIASVKMSTDEIMALTRG